MLLERNKCKEKAPVIFHLVLFLLFIGLINFIVFTFILLKYTLAGILDVLNVKNP